MVVFSKNFVKVDPFVVHFVKVAHLFWWTFESLGLLYLLLLSKWKLQKIVFAAAFGVLILNLAKRRGAFHKFVLAK